MQKSLIKLVNRAEAVFWDFDGVIKESVEIKSKAFEELFSTYGSNITDKIRIHHERNGGISRFEKIPLYLSWSKGLATNEMVQDFCDRFSLLVKQSVIDSPWVPGFLVFMAHNCKRQKHILVTATPVDEIEEILEGLNIKHFFYKIYGSPATKKNAINLELKNLKINPENAIMFGDSSSDYEAARDNGILFLLRCTGLNKDLQRICKDNVFKDFTNE